MSDFTMDLESNRSRNGYSSTVHLDVLPQILRLLFVDYTPSMNDIQTIKQIRELSTMSLKDAKGLVDCAKGIIRKNAEVDYRESFEQLSIDYKKLSEDNEQLRTQLHESFNNDLDDVMTSVVQDYKQTIIMEELQKVIDMQNDVITELGEKIRKLNQQNTDLIDKFVFGRDVK